MLESLVKKSDIKFLKYKFFINRALTYFSFLLIPVWLQETLKFNLFTQANILLMYMIFMAGQWYLFGKEIDHRLKIFYKVTSSLDRIVYRLFLGSTILIILFNFIGLFSENIWKYFFWTFFACIGIFYSWPTRGKIIEDSVSFQLGEFRFLDSFEKTVVFFSIFTFFISLPEIPMFENIEALKLYFDPSEKVSAIFWRALEITYSPFKNYPKLYNLIWSLHFYFLGTGVFLIAFYAVTRQLFSRRLAFLGVFAVLSTWSFTRILSEDYLSGLSTTYSLILLWSFLWSLQSGTYRSGLIVGLVSFYGVILNPLNFFYIPVILCFQYFIFMKEQTTWFKKQWLKYTLLGVVLSLLVFLTNLEKIQFDFLNFTFLKLHILDLVSRKAFFVIAPFGLCYLFLSKSKSYSFLVDQAGFNHERVKQINLMILTIFLFGIIINPYFISGFNLIWPLVLYALIPLDRIFHSISKQRSRRNIIYTLYILVCLMDSQLENRIRIVAKMFLDSESYKFLIQL